MLKSIHKLPCSPALAACQRLMRDFALRLCDPATTSVNITHAGLQPPTLPNTIEADWLWDFLQRKRNTQTMLVHAQAIANLDPQNKASLQSWIQAVSPVHAQFQGNAPAWPAAQSPIPKREWQAFLTLMQAFYEIGLRGGLPYQADGAPVAQGGLTYAEFVQSFRDAHRFNPSPGAREVCVLCGGHFGQTPEVDHWVSKADYPLLSVCADNLLPVCGECNSTSNKGQKAVFEANGFADWFHPYLRHANGGVRLNYVLPALEVRCAAADVNDQAKVNNLDSLLNLGVRWTREFKAEYAKQQDVLRRRQKQRLRDGQPSYTLQCVEQHVWQWMQDLLPTEPYYEVHAELGRALQDLSRTQSWLDELSAV